MTTTSRQQLHDRYLEAALQALLEHIDDGHRVRIHSESGDGDTLVVQLVIPAPSEYEQRISEVMTRTTPPPLR